MTEKADEEDTLQSALPIEPLPWIGLIICNNLILGYSSKAAIYR
jgi:hypothetical protein